MAARSSPIFQISDYNISTWINTINRAVSNCNTILNLPTSLSYWLKSNNLVILENPIEGYNNRLKTATSSMHFWINQIYYEKHKVVPKKVHQEAQHLQNLANSEISTKKEINVMPTQ